MNKSLLKSLLFAYAVALTSLLVYVPWLAVIPNYGVRYQLGFGWLWWGPAQRFSWVPARAYLFGKPDTTTIGLEAVALTVAFVVVYFIAAFAVTSLRSVRLGDLLPPWVPLPSRWRSSH